jgi:hypothetical protein
LNYRELNAKLTVLEAKITAVRAEEEILTDARIDSSKLGGIIALSSVERTDDPAVA